MMGENEGREVNIHLLFTLQRDNSVSKQAVRIISFIERGLYIYKVILYINENYISHKSERIILQKAFFIFLNDMISHFFASSKT